MQPKGPVEHGLRWVMVDQVEEGGQRDQQHSCLEEFEDRDEPQQPGPRSGCHAALLSPCTPSGLQGRTSRGEAQGWLAVCSILAGMWRLLILPSIRGKHAVSLHQDEKGREALQAPCPQPSYS